jgi:tellurite resistance protein
MSVTYEQIESLIISRSLEGSRMVCEFRTPSGEIVSATASIKRERDVSSQISRNMQRVAATQTRMAVTRTLSSALGGGIFGRAASMVVRTASTPQALGINYSESEKKAAVVEAFEKVSAHFSMDDSSGSWKAPAISPSKSADQLSMFERQLSAYPVTNKYDKEILSRMLVEVANVDGNISEEERSFMESFIPAEIGTINSLLRWDKLSEVECEEVSAPVKKTIYMLAWINAMVDYEIDPDEKAMLMEFAEMLGLSDSDTREMIKASKYYILENAFGEDLNRSELFELADCLQLAHDEAERCLIQYKKRK